MLRLIPALLAMMLLPTMPAAAAPEGVGVGPSGVVTDPAEKHYVMVVPSGRVAVHEAREEQNCAPQKPGPAETVEGHATEISQWDPTTQFYVSGWFPQCLATGVDNTCDGCPYTRVHAFAAYNVATGDYYVVLGASTPSGIGAPPGLPTIGGFMIETYEQMTAAEADVNAGGNSGAGVIADCAGCPPPP